jgi:hypothetical protein
MRGDLIQAGARQVVVPVLVVGVDRAKELEQAVVDRHLGRMG